MIYGSGPLKADLAAAAAILLDQFELLAEALVAKSIVLTRPVSSHRL
jgi:hypothetical protein